MAQATEPRSSTISSIRLSSPLRKLTIEGASPTNHNIEERTPEWPYVHGERGLLVMPKMTWASTALEVLIGKFHVIRPNCLHVWKLHPTTSPIRAEVISIRARKTVPAEGWSHTLLSWLLWIALRLYMSSDVVCISCLWSFDRKDLQCNVFPVDQRVLSKPNGRAASIRKGTRRKVALGAVRADMEEKNQRNAELECKSKEKMTKAQKGKKEVSKGICLERGEDNGGYDRTWR